MSGNPEAFFGSRLWILWASAVVSLTLGFGFHGGSHLSTSIMKLVLHNCC